MLARSNRIEVRNPAMADSEIIAIAAEMVPGERLALRRILLRVRRIAVANAAICLRKHKAPMYLYWKLTGVWAYHIARVLK